MYLPLYLFYYLYYCHNYSFLFLFSLFFCHCHSPLSFTIPFFPTSFFPLFVPSILNFKTF